MISASRLETAMISLAPLRGYNFKAKLQLRTRCTLISIVPTWARNYLDEVPGQEDQVEESLCHLLLEIRSENSGCLGRKVLERRELRSTFQILN